MSDPALILSQWFSAKNAGGVPADSCRLPWIIKAGEVRTASDLAVWLETIVTDGPAYHDTIYLMSAYEAKNDTVLAALSDVYLDYGHSAKRRAEITHQGQIFSRRVRRLHGMDVAKYSYPVAVGAAAGRLGAPFDMTIRMYLEAFVTRLVTAAAPGLGLDKQAQRDAVDAVRPQIAALSKSGHRMPVPTAPTVSSVPAWLSGSWEPWADMARHA